jgi:hypothetical protein
MRLFTIPGLSVLGLATTAITSLTLFIVALCPAAADAAAEFNLSFTGGGLGFVAGSTAGAERKVLDRNNGTGAAEAPVFTKTYLNKESEEYLLVKDTLPCEGQPLNPGEICVKAPVIVELLKEIKANEPKREVTVSTTKPGKCPGMLKFSTLP